jgi:uncharacterized protein YjbJ (UPF0337 family)
LGKAEKSVGNAKEMVKDAKASVKATLHRN